MNGKAKAIETRYAGHRFRSRLEARWAVFMDTAGVPWTYEPEGFDLGDAGHYLPDFLVYPQADDDKFKFWLEIKGTFPSESELAKARALAIQTQTRVFVYFGECGIPAEPSLMEMGSFRDFYNIMDGPVQLEWGWNNRDGWQERYSADRPTGTWEVGVKPTAFPFFPSKSGLVMPRVSRSNHWWWTDCPHCGLVFLKLAGQVGECPSFGGHVPASAEPVYPRFAHATERLQAAYTAARSARFEHGESGGNHRDTG